MKMIAVVTAVILDRIPHTRSVTRIYFPLSNNCTKEYVTLIHTKNLSDWSGQQHIESYNSGLAVNDIP